MPKAPPEVNLNSAEGQSEAPTASLSSAEVAKKHIKTLGAVLFGGIAVLFAQPLSTLFPEPSMEAVIILLVWLLATATLSLGGALWFIRAGAFTHFHEAVIEPSKRLLGDADERTQGQLRELDERIEDTKYLLETSQQLVALQKSERPWIVDDEECLKIEGSTLDEILVVTIDLYYEEQDDYQEVIVENIMKEPGPTYRYLIRSGPGKKNFAEHVLRKLADRMRAAGMTDPADQLNERFQVCMVPAEDFPASSLYGLAVYLSGDSQRCLQYLPREIGSLNIDIPREVGPGDKLWGPDLIWYVCEDFDRLFERFADNVITYEA